MNYEWTLMNTNKNRYKGQGGKGQGDDKFFPSIFIFIRVHSWLIVFALMLMAGSAFGQNATPPAKPLPQYPVDYRRPIPDDVKQTLEHIRSHLETAIVFRIIDTHTHEPIADLTKPTMSAALDQGPEKKYSIVSYPIGVIDSGMLAASAATGDKQFADFVAKQFQFFADNLPALATWPREYERRNPLRNLLEPTSLDSCGALGAALVQARLAHVGPDMMEVIDRWANYVSHKQFRLSDGTLARNNPFPQSLWLDDAYMSVPLLTEMGKMTGDVSYFDDAARQMKLFYAHLFVPSAGLFTHAMHMGNPDDQPKYYWGRANGWYAVALVTLLEDLPANHPDRAALIQILKTHAMGLAGCQSGTGLWHQMLDRQDSYLETSCSAMFTYAIAKAVNHGWLDAGTYGPVAIAGWIGVNSQITDDGRVKGTCIGTSYAGDYVYYMHRPAADDPHGYGPTLLAGAEMIKLLQNSKYRITGGSGDSPIMMIDRPAWMN